MERMEKQVSFCDWQPWHVFCDMLGILTTLLLIGKGDKSKKPKSGKDSKDSHDKITKGDDGKHIKVSLSSPASD